jgi:pimeloyl-ACP methyl ester carboxylesterase
MTLVKRFASYDGTSLAYHTIGESDRPLVCVPGGPAQSAAYLGDLGGLTGLVMLDNRATGGSDRAADPESYRADRLAEDIEALRIHLGLSRMDLLGHSAGAGVAMIYAARYPERIERLILVTPGLRAAGFELTGEQWLKHLEIRRGEPWFEEAYEAVRNDGPRQLCEPFYYGRWDEAARKYSEAQHRDEEAKEWYFTTDWKAVAAPTVEGLAALKAPVLVVAGELDPGPTPAMAARFVEMLGNGRLVVQPNAGHFPWVDDPDAFSGTVREFLGA